MSTSPENLFAALDELSDQLDRATVVELIEVYTDTSAAQMAKIDQAAASGNLSEINAQAHSLKSSSANMGAIRLSEVCVQLEKAKVIDAHIHTYVKSAHQLREQAIALMQGWKTRKSA
jgi:HPt (histidine-containing phosphotransfer) domain-containing protein